MPEEDSVFKYNQDKKTLKIPLVDKNPKESSLGKISKRTSFGYS